MSDAAHAVLGVLTILHVLRYGPMLVGWSVAGASAALLYSAVTQPDLGTVCAAAGWFWLIALQVRFWLEVETESRYVPRPAVSHETAACGLELDECDEIELAQAAGAMAEGRVAEGRARFERWLDDTIPNWRDLR